MAYRKSPDLKTDEELRASQDGHGIRVYKGPDIVNIRRANGGGAYATIGSPAKNSGVVMNHQDSAIDVRTPGK